MNIEFRKETRLSDDSRPAKIYLLQLHKINVLVNTYKQCMYAIKYHFYFFSDKQPPFLNIIKVYNTKTNT